MVSQHVQSINSAKKSIDKDLRAIDDVLIDNFFDAEIIPSTGEYGSSVSGREEIEDDLHTNVNQSLAVRRERRHVNMPARYAEGAEMVVVRVKEPRSVKESMTLPERQNWTDAMKAELDALVENGTWEIVDEPKKGTNIVDSKLF